MVIEDGSRLYLYVPITGPTGWDPGDVTGELALAVDGDDPEWHEADWVGQELRLLVGTVGTGGGAIEYADGEYVAKARLTVGLERVVTTAHRVQVGN